MASRIKTLCPLSPPGPRPWNILEPHKMYPNCSSEVTPTDTSQTLHRSPQISTVHLRNIRVSLHLGVANLLTFFQFGKLQNMPLHRLHRLHSAATVVSKQSVPLFFQSRSFLESPPKCASYEMMEVPPPPLPPSEGRSKKLQLAAAFNAAHEEGCACCVPEKSSLAPGFWKTVGFGEKAGRSNVSKCQAFLSYVRADAYGRTRIRTCFDSYMHTAT